MNYQIIDLLQQVVVEQNTHLKQFASIVTATQELTTATKDLTIRVIFLEKDLTKRVIFLEKELENIKKINFNFCIYMIVFVIAFLYYILI
jgi:hypothetical protein